MTTEEYVSAQKDWMKRNKVRNGSEVSIIRTAMSGEGGWSDTWTECMSQKVDCTGSVKINNIHDAGKYGVPVQFRDGHTWNFPYFVLEPVVSDGELICVLANWLSNYNDCPYDENRVCEFKVGDRCRDMNRAHPECWIKCAKEVLTRGRVKV